MELTQNEAAFLRQLAERLTRLKEAIQETQQPPVDGSPQEWFGYLAMIKGIQGNFSNALSFVSCLMAKEYLSERFEFKTFDVALKPQGANGLDIDEVTVDDERVIGEIKTTTPHLGTRFGAAQLTSMRKDFAKLRDNRAEHKYMFVTDVRAYDVLQKHHKTQLAGVSIVCLYMPRSESEGS